MIDFKTVFEHLNAKSDISDMDTGYLQFILMLANFVLQKLDINLSIKESALKIALDILENNTKVRNIDLVRLTINLLRSNYVGKDLSYFLSKLLKRISAEDLALILKKQFEYDSIARQKLI